MNSLLSTIKAFVLKNRPAYKDYLGNGKYDVKKLPEECVPDSVNDNIRMAQSTANAAQSTANAAQSTANAAQSTANAAQSTADAAKSTADAAQSTADAAQSTADAAQSTAETRLMVYGESTETTVTIDSLGSSGSAASVQNLGALNIENGSRISITVSDMYRAENVWNGYSRSFILNMPGIAGNEQVVLTLLPNGNVQIINQSGTNLTNVVITYRKIEVRNTYYNMTSGVWLPPYLCCSCIYLVSSVHTNNGYPVYKITVDNTGTLKATEVT